MLLPPLQDATLVALPQRINLGGTLPLKAALLSQGAAPTSDSQSRAGEAGSQASGCQGMTVTTSMSSCPASLCLHPCELFFLAYQLTVSLQLTSPRPITQATQADCRCSELLSWLKVSCALGAEFTTSPWAHASAGL